jgi:disulfide bond formation protein DsbB
MGKSAMAIPSRAVFAFIFIACAGLIADAVFYMQETLGLEPCPMCILQRYAYIAAGIVALVAAIHGRAARVYGSLVVLFALAGAGVAIRHTYITYFPPKTSSCGADLDFMLGNFPLTQALPKIFAGTGDCAVVTWRFLGLSIPEWSIVWFTIFGALGLWMALRRTAARS